MSEDKEARKSNAIVFALVVSPVLLFVLLVVFIDEANTWLANANLQLAEFNAWLANVNGQIDEFSSWFYPTMIEFLLALLVVVALGLLVRTIYQFVAGRGEN